MAEKQVQPEEEHDEPKKVYAYIIIAILALTAVVQVFTILSNIMKTDGIKIYSPGMILFITDIVFWAGLNAAARKNTYVQRQIAIKNKVGTLFGTVETEDTENVSLRYQYSLYVMGTVVFILLVLGIVSSAIFLSRYGDLYIKYLWPEYQTFIIVTMGIWAACLTAYLIYIKNVVNKFITRDIVLPIGLLTGVFLQSITYLASQIPV